MIVGRPRMILAGVLSLTCVASAGCGEPGPSCADGRDSHWATYSESRLESACGSDFAYQDSQIVVHGEQVGDSIPWAWFEVMSWPAGVHVAVNRAATSSDPVTRAEYGNNHWYPIGVELDSMASGSARDGDYVDLCGDAPAEVTLWGTGGATTPYGENDRDKGAVARPEFAMDLRPCGGVT